MLTRPPPRQSSATGIGVRFNAELAKQYPDEMTEPPHFHRPDGSHTND